MKRKMEFDGKRLIRGLVDAGLVLCGVIWLYSLFTFAGGTMDTSMEAEAVTHYQLWALAVLVGSNILLVVLFKIRKKIKEQR